MGLIRLAYLMLGDRAAAEDVVQDAFCGLYRNWGRLADPSGALPHATIVHDGRGTSIPWSRYIAVAAW